ncbi:MazG nucleotide pyrophosphohydrolase domain-containing protein [Leucobacter sp. UT-8R-CII-1-4]|uniref:MazG nucleotide pyrophosphohydrolase domain-containing protein n=1 Tax=Leucobacter sp. UT-8R-CII-1-4 TaxID=3040075 RepID=UPI0024A8DD52|nr:MazG nucleotide pyrophosphohydrolase domain-containing protein [Leucobacter sp. UT-8R-CII-1-4]MDI6021986.1 MazG nucleotide pyrophosphohydrolase domain-containing protein [Leucobacter sp. UT-8R-CII-1-4]
MVTSESGLPEQHGVEAALATVRRMVFPDGCAWHAVQTHETLVPYLIEESAEFVDAIERNLPAEEVSGELGDVLYQVLFHAVLAERDGEGYDLNSIGHALSEKLQARHPHVFGDRGYLSVDELNAEWERLKEDAAGERRGSRGALEGIPAGMPTLARSAKVVERLKRAQLLDPAAETEDKTSAGSGVAAAAESSPEPVAGAVADSSPMLGEQELGDAILALIMQANAAGLDPDRALRLATNRLADRLDP